MIIPIIAIVLFMFHVLNLIESQDMLNEAKRDLDTAKGKDTIQQLKPPLTYDDCLERLITDLEECQRAIKYREEELKRIERWGVK